MQQTAGFPAPDPQPGSSQRNSRLGGMISAADAAINRSDWLMVSEDCLELICSRRAEVEATPSIAGIGCLFPLQRQRHILSASVLPIDLPTVLTSGRDG